MHTHWTTKKLITFGEEFAKAKKEQDVENGKIIREAEDQRQNNVHKSNL